MRLLATATLLAFAVLALPAQAAASVDFDAATDEATDDEAITVEGTLGGDPMLEGGCVWLDAGDDRYEVAWPDGYDADTDPVALTGPDGGTVAVEGDQLEVDGAVLTDAMTLCQVGPLLDVTSVATTAASSVQIDPEPDPDDEPATDEPADDEGEDRDSGRADDEGAGATDGERPEGDSAETGASAGDGSGDDVSSAGGESPNADGETAVAAAATGGGEDETGVLSSELPHTGAPTALLLLAGLGLAAGGTALRAPARH